MSKSRSVMAIGLLGGALLFTSWACAAEFGKIVKVSGDRQISVGPFPTSLGPFSVKALSTSGAPLAGVPLHIQRSNTGNRNVPPTFSFAFNADEFGFYGFFTDQTSLMCGSNGAVFTVSNDLGIATGTPGDAYSPPAAFLVGAKAGDGKLLGYNDFEIVQFFSIVRVVNPPAGQPQVVVEYFHDGYRNYFNTIDQGEIDALDAGSFAGWTREVGSFIAWPTQAAAPPGAVPVCRFFGSVYASHFYTADPGECDAVVANFPDWQLETRQAFWIFLPDKATGACAENLMPVYRVLKPTAPNHRYVTDRNVRDTMVVFGGWIAEGYGPDAVIMCTPR